MTTPIPATLGVYSNEENFLHQVHANPSYPKRIDLQGSPISFLVHSWIGVHHPTLQPHLYELVERIRHISHEDFLVALNASLENALSQLNECYGREFIPSKDAIVLVEGTKSNKWVAELALKQGDFLPTYYFRLGDKEAKNFSEFCSRLKDKDLMDLQKDFDNKTIVLFDDGSYSGRQLTGHVLGIANTICKFELFVKIICVVVPFMTTHAKQEIQQAMDHLKEHPQLIIAEHSRIETLADLPEEAQSAMMIAWYLNQTCNPNCIGLTWFDHKCPNSESFPKPLLNASVYNPDGSASTKIFQGKFFEDIIPPYKF